MDAPAPSSPLEAMLTDLAEHGMRAVRVNTTALEAEQAIIRIATAALPDEATPASFMEATTLGLDIDAAAAALAAGSPRIQTQLRGYEKLARSVRQTIALLRRLQNGWTGTRPPATNDADTRAAMQKRQVKAGVTAKLRDSDAEPAERLFDDLNEHLFDDVDALLDAVLDAPGLDAEIAATSVEAVIERVAAEIAKDIAHAIATCAPLLPATSAAHHPPHPPDTG